VELFRGVVQTSTPLGRSPEKRRGGSTGAHRGIVNPICGIKTGSRRASYETLSGVIIEFAGRSTRNRGAGRCARRSLLTLDLPDNQGAAASALQTRTMSRSSRWRCKSSVRSLRNSPPRATLAEPVAQKHLENVGVRGPGILVVRRQAQIKVYLISRAMERRNRRRPGVQALAEETRMVPAGIDRTPIQKKSSSCSSRPWRAADFEHISASPRWQGVTLAHRAENRRTCPGSRGNTAPGKRPRRAGCRSTSSRPGREQPRLLYGVRRVVKDLQLPPAADVKIEIVRYALHRSALGCTP